MSKLSLEENLGDDEGDERGLTLKAGTVVENADTMPGIQAETKAMKRFNVKTDLPMLLSFFLI